MKLLLILLVLFSCSQKEVVKEAPTATSTDEQVLEISKSPMDKIAYTYARKVIEYPELKVVTLAQWMLESGRGSSDLAKKHNNYAGLKWRGTLGVEGATHIKYKAHDGWDNYAKLPSHDKFIEYYWKFLDRDIYKGWRKRADDPRKFIQFLLDCGYTTSDTYLDNVMRLMKEADTLLRASYP